MKSPNMQEARQNGAITEEIVKMFRNRESSTCDHCERQYDDSVCDKCLAQRLWKAIKKALDDKDFAISEAEARGRLAENEACAKVVESSCRVEHNSDVVCFYNACAQAIRQRSSK